MTFAYCLLLALGVSGPHPSRLMECASAITASRSLMFDEGLLFLRVDMK